MFNVLLLICAILTYIYWVEIVGVLSIVFTWGLIILAIFLSLPFIKGVIESLNEDESAPSQKKEERVNESSQKEIKRRSMTDDEAFVCECMDEPEFLKVKEDLKSFFKQEKWREKIPRGLLYNYYELPFWVKNSDTITIEELDRVISMFYQMALAININKYIEPLLRKRSQLCRYDDYGDLIDAAWKVELVKFTQDKWYAFERRVFIPKNISKVFSEINGYCESFQFHKPIHEVIDDIGTQANAIDSLLIACEKNSSSDIGLTASTYIAELNKITNPYDYEKEVGIILSSMGWKVKVTPGSGDQGVDVAAELDNTRLVIQCKLYSQPVSNKAIQEVHAGKSFMRYTHAAVVTNSTFTKSARQLAHSLDVILIEQNNILQLHRTLTR